MTAAHPPIPGLVTFKCEGGLHDRCVGTRWTFTLGPVRCACSCHIAAAGQQSFDLGAFA